MSTDTKEQTQAEARQTAARKQVQKLTTEREELVTRQRTATAEVDRLNGQLDTTAEARDVTALAALRKQMQEQQTAVEDMDRILATIDRELTLAQAELCTATIARHAEKYNAFGAQQRSLVATIEEAIDTIVQAVVVKEGLATKQKNIQVSDDSIATYSFQSVTDFRPLLLSEITSRLSQPAGFPKSLQKLDWSCRQMSEHGDLLEPGA